jgi:hypothetical protein
LVNAGMVNAGGARFLPVGKNAENCEKRAKMPFRKIR